jgi:hypothetical protein
MALLEAISTVLVGWAAKKAFEKAFDYIVEQVDKG